MIRITVLLAILLSLSACGGDESSTMPAATAFTLSGIVFNGGFGVSGVSVAIMDGVHTGQTRTTDNAGRFNFTNLTPSAFTLRATATYAAQNKSVSITTSDQSVNFDLPDH